VLLLGAGLSLTVAPLTATVLGSLDDRHAGLASGVNNAVARAASLLAVAVLPLAAGLGSGSLTDPGALAPTFRAAMRISAVLLLVAAAISAAFVPGKRPQPTAAPALAPRGRRRFHCSVDAPPLHPRQASGGR
jgi:hypothetical protein